MGLRKIPLATLLVVVSLEVAFRIRAVGRAWVVGGLVVEIMIGGFVVIARLFSVREENVAILWILIVKACMLTADMFMECGDSQ